MLKQIAYLSAIVCMVALVVVGTLQFVVAVSDGGNGPLMQKESERYSVSAEDLAWECEQRGSYGFTWRPVGQDENQFICVKTEAERDRVAEEIRAQEQAKLDEITGSGVRLQYDERTVYRVNR